MLRSFAFVSLYVLIFSISIPALANVHPLLIKANRLQGEQKFDSVKVCSEQILALAKELPDQVDLPIWATFYKAVAIQRYDSTAYELALQALDGFKVIKNEFGIAKCYGLLGLIEGYRGDWAKGNIWNRENLALMQNPESTLADSFRIEWIQKTYFNIAVNQLKNSQLDSAMETSSQLRELAEKEQNYPMLVNTTMLIGTVYYQLGKVKESKELFLRTYALQLEHDLHIQRNHVFNNLAGIYYMEEKHDSSLIFSRKAIKMALEKNDQTSLTSYWLNVGTIMGELGQPDSAEYYIYKSIELSEKLNKKDIPISGYSYLSKVYFDNKQLQRSIAFGKKAEAIFKSFHFPSAEIEVYKTMYEAYQEMGDYKNAFLYFERFENMEDSMQSKELLDKVDEWQAKYQTAIKEQTITELSEKNKLQAIKIRQNYAVLAGAGILFLLLLSTLYFYNRQRILQERQHAMEIEQRLLRSQMNPHFLFNTLSSIQTFLLEKDNKQTAIFYLSKFSKLMRQVLEHSRERFIPLEEEINTLKNYLSLQQMRHDNRFSFNFEIDPSINTERVLIPPMMIQPFIENAILHGRVHQVESGEINLSVIKKEEELILKIEDNGVGREQAAVLKNKNKHRSLASTILEDRIALLQRSMKKKIEYFITDRPESGTKVQFQFPLILD